MKLMRIFTAGKDNSNVLSMQTMERERTRARSPLNSSDKFITPSSLKHRMLDKSMKYI